MSSMAIIEVHHPNAFNDFGIIEPMTVQLAIDEDSIDGMSAEQVAEAVFEATNKPFTAVPCELTLVGQIFASYTAHAAEGRYYPTLSVGDLVRVPNNSSSVDTVLVEPIGYRHIGENNIELAGQPDHRGR